VSREVGSEHDHAAFSIRAGTNDWLDQRGFSEAHDDASFIRVDELPLPPLSHISGNVQASRNRFGFPIKHVNAPSSRKVRQKSRIRSIVSNVACAYSGSGCAVRACTFCQVFAMRLTLHAR